MFSKNLTRRFLNTVKLSKDWSNQSNIPSYLYIIRRCRVYRRSSFQGLSQKWFLKVSFLLHVVTQWWAIASRSLLWWRTQSTLVQFSPTVILPRIAWCRLWKSNILQLLHWMVELKLSLIFRRLKFIFTGALPLFPPDDEGGGIFAVATPLFTSANPRTWSICAVLRKADSCSCPTWTSPWYMKRSNDSISDEATSLRITIGCWHGFAYRANKWGKKKQKEKRKRKEESPLSRKKSYMADENEF